LEDNLEDKKEPENPEVKENLPEEQRETQSEAEPRSQPEPLLEVKPDEVKEKTEEILKELLEEEKETPSPEKPKKTPNFKSLLLLSLALILVIALFAGVWVLYKLLKKEEVKAPKLEIPKEERALKKEETQNKTTDTTKKIASQEKSLPQSSPKYPYRLELKNFLIALDEKTFLKCDIYLYFKTYEDLKGALKSELILRNFFTQKIKQTKPSLWRDEKELLGFEKNLLEELKKVDLKMEPAEVEIEPVLLKV